MDENLDNYIQYLLAKVAEADKPLSAIDLEKEERVQKQKKATEDLLTDNQQIFSLWNELVCAKELLAELLRQQKSIAVSYGCAHDSDVGDVSEFASIPEEAELTIATDEYNPANMSVAGISSSEDEDAGDAEDDEDNGSTVSVSRLSEENLSKRIATVKSMIEVAKKELFQLMPPP